MNTIPFFSTSCSSLVARGRFFPFFFSKFINWMFMFSNGNANLASAPASRGSLWAMESSWMLDTVNIYFYLIKTLSYDSLPHKNYISKLPSSGSGIGTQQSSVIKLCFSHSLRAMISSELCPSKLCSKQLLWPHTKPNYNSSIMWTSKPRAIFSTLLIHLYSF